jgi:hypothetical protein
MLFISLRRSHREMKHLTCVNAVHATACCLCPAELYLLTKMSDEWFHTFQPFFLLPVLLR